MKKLSILKTLLLLSAFTAFLSCGSDEGSDYKEISPVVVDLTTVPYPKLSDYKFFTGEMKNLEPAYKVLPYDLNSSLFTDYAHKKRFVWMPEGKQAIYTSDGEVLNFPVGAVLIKNFYYENVQPDNSTKIIETRLMIKKANDWVFATYVWNNEQTEAYLDMNGSNMDITWLQDGGEMSINYNIPTGEDCIRCHANGSAHVAIGPKPQNLFKDFTYKTGVQNQLAKWKEEGYLDSFSQNTLATVNWEDTTKSLNLRARSYLDINCAHCHRPGGGCDVMPLNFSFTSVTDRDKLGICVPPHDFINGDEDYIIEAQNGGNSLMITLMSSRKKDEMMPLIGRTISHGEGVELILEWIDSMDEPCP
jgi:uncharacterized repeat protein (TIGR03806 family)